jgi:hypothetical protein
MHAAPTERVRYSRRRGLFGHLWRWSWFHSPVRRALDTLAPLVGSRSATIDVVEYETETDVRAEGEVRGVLVRAEISVHGLLGLATHRVVKARYIHGAGPSFVLHRSIDFSSRTPLVDDPRLAALSFDSSTYVRSAEPLFALHAISPRARELLRESLRNRYASITSDQTEIRMHFSGDSSLLPTFDAVGEIAQCAREWFEAFFRSVPDAEYVPPSGPFGARTQPNFVVPLRGQFVRFFVRTGHQTFALAASLAVDAGGAPFTFELGSSEPEILRARPRAAEAARRAGRGTLTWDGATMQFVFYGPPSTERLLAAGELLVEMVGTRSLGVFR